jgi:hypothetical protein
MHELSRNVLAAQTELEELLAQEKALDEYIAQMSSGLQELCSAGAARSGSGGLTNLAYLTRADLRSIEAFQGQTVIGLRAPPETAVWVPHPDQVPRISVSLSLLSLSSSLSYRRV